MLTLKQIQDGRDEVIERLKIKNFDATAIVDQIIEDFKSGKESSAAFWIQFQGRFIYIEYFAMRGSEGEYLGTVEFTQDLTKLRALEGEQRLLNYSK